MFVWLCSKIIDRQDNDGATPLYLAVKKNNSELAEVLILNKAGMYYKT